MVLQTESKLASVRAYGCYFCSLVYIWAQKRHRDITVPTLDLLFGAAVQAGVILDNTVRIGDAGWFRAFVVNPVGLFRVLDAWAGTSKTIVRETYRGATLTDSPPDEATVIEYRTKNGSHFVVGRIEEGEAFVLYNPDPRISGQEIRTVRHWSLA